MVATLSSPADAAPSFSDVTSSDSEAPRKMTVTSNIVVRRVSVGDYEFHLNEAGDAAKPPVLFLHGSGPGATGASNWERVLADMSDDYYCLAPDMIGFGDSTHPDPPPQGLGPFTQLRVDLTIALLDELGIDRVSLVGNSMGGMWSLGVVRQAPERVDKLVLMGSGGAPVAPGPNLRALVNFYDDPTADAMASMMEGFVYDPSFLGDDLRSIAETRLERAVRPEVERSHSATFDLSNPWSFTEEDLGNISQDVLVIHAREDQLVAFDAGVYFFQRIPNARLYGIGRCGHWTQIEAHDFFVGALRAFLAGQI